MQDTINAEQAWQHIESNSHEDLAQPVLTPEIEVLAQKVAQWHRCGLPGGATYGLQRIGKSAGRRFLKRTLPLLIGKPVCAVSFSVPSPCPRLERGFYCEFLRQAKYAVTAGRDTAVLKERLFNWFVFLAEREKARDIFLLVDEAQNLCDANRYGHFVHIFNQLEDERLRPFVLMMGQPELKQQAAQFLNAGQLEIFGRFFSNMHEFHGIELADLSTVLANFDDGTAGPCVTQQQAPLAFSKGWRAASMAQPMQEALVSIVDQAKLKGTLRVPMQWLVATLADIGDVVAHSPKPVEIGSQGLIASLTRLNFVAVMPLYMQPS